MEKSQTINCYFSNLLIFGKIVGPIYIQYQEYFEYQPKDSYAKSFIPPIENCCVYEDNYNTREGKWDVIEYSIFLQALILLLENDMSKEISKIYGYRGREFVEITFITNDDSNIFKPIDFSVQSPDKCCGSRLFEIKNKIEIKLNQLQNLGYKFIFKTVPREENLSRNISIKNLIGS